MQPVYAVLVRTAQAAVEASTTILIGIFVAAVMRRMLGAAGTRKLFGGDGWNGLLRAWGVGMLLPVCSLGVIPIAREMKRAGVRTGTILAFVLAAPHLNPLSLLYGLTLSEPVVIVCFAVASLAVALFAGWVWDRFFEAPGDSPAPEDELTPAPGVWRLASVAVTAAREAVEPAMLFVVAGLAFTGALAGLLPHGVLSNTMRHDDPTSPALMTALALPMYCGPLQGMMRLGLIFEHGNSVGAAFSLFELGIGVNLGLILWLAVSFGVRRVLPWLALVTALTVALAYASEPSLYFAKEEASHTHAFDDWTNPFVIDVSAATAVGKVAQKIEILEPVALIGLAGLLLLGIGLARFDRSRRLDAWLALPPAPKPGGFRDVVIPGPVLGVVALVGLVVFSVVALYIYYPEPKDAFRDIVRVRADALVAVRANNREEAIRQLQLWDLMTRKLQVGDFLRSGVWDADKNKATEDLRERIEDMRDAVIADDHAKAMQLMRDVNEAYAKCREGYPVVAD